MLATASDVFAVAASSPRATRDAARPRFGSPRGPGRRQGCTARPSWLAMGTASRPPPAGQPGIEARHCRYRRWAVGDGDGELHTGRGAAALRLAGRPWASPGVRIPPRPARHGHLATGATSARSRFSSTYHICHLYITQHNVSGIFKFKAGRMPRPNFLPHDLRSPSGTLTSQQRQPTP